jgi:hypothetical protein
MRTGTLIIGALIFALAAAGVLVWTNVLKLPGQPEAPATVPSAPSPVASAPLPREAQLVTAMNEAAAGGGIAISFKGEDVGKWKLANGHRLERFSLDAAGPVFARLSSSMPLEWTSNQWPTQGLSVLLPRQFAEASNGRTVEIGVIARTAPVNGSPRITALYATQQAGNSQWQSIVLKPQFEMYKFTYTVPSLEGGYAAEPILVFHSDPSGAGHAVEMIGAYVKLLP